MPDTADHPYLRGTVKQYPYRTAHVRDVTFDTPRDGLHALEQMLALAAGVTVDNHTVYEITSPAGVVLYLWFSDLTVYFGHQVEVVDTF